MSKRGHLGAWLGDASIGCARSRSDETRPHPEPGSFNNVGTI
jgi:hypothetical protein